VWCGVRALLSLEKKDLALLQGNSLVKVCKISTTARVFGVVAQGQDDSYKRSVLVSANAFELALAVLAVLDNVRLRLGGTHGRPANAIELADPFSAPLQEHVVLCLDGGYASCVQPWRTSRRLAADTRRRQRHLPDLSGQCARARRARA
jgi:hypothetical protein